MRIAEFEYNFLPRSIILRLIVRQHTIIHKEQYWQSGVVLTFEDAEALVRSDQEDRIIYIAITKGSPIARRELLAIIRAELSRIHKTLKSLEVTPWISAPGYPDKKISYDYVRQNEAMGVPSVAIPGINDQIFSIEELLYGVEGGLAIDTPKSLSEWRTTLSSLRNTELKNMVFDLGDEYEEFEGETKNDRLRAYLSYMSKHSRMGEVSAYCFAKFKYLFK